jgi:hypothetical protein
MTIKKSEWQEFKLKHEHLYLDYKKIQKKSKQTFSETELIVENCRERGIDYKEIAYIFNCSLWKVKDIDKRVQRKRRWFMRYLVMNKYVKDSVIVDFDLI